MARMAANENGNRAKRDRSLRVQSDAWRPGEKFCDWIRWYKVGAVAETIVVERITIYRWLNGERPPHPDHAKNLIKLSKKHPGGIGPLTLEDVYGKDEQV